MNMQVTPQNLTTAVPPGPPQPIAEPEHVMEIINYTGHDTLTWDPTDEASVVAARGKFNQLKRDGYTPFEMDIVSENGVTHERKSGRIARQFDPQAGRYMMVPQLVGG